LTVLSADELAEALGIPAPRAQEWADALNSAMDRFDIATPERQAGFLSQVGHESCLLTALSENLNYSATALLRVFPRHFDQDSAQAYQRNPEKIANRAYANRMGNGDEASGDGYRFRGRGLIQITGRANYQACGTALGQPLIDTPEMLEKPECAALSAAWFWASNGLNAIADRKDVAAMTQRVNGGTLGLDDRERLYAKVADVLTA
jgi:putative chitinase